MYRRGVGSEQYQPLFPAVSGPLETSKWQYRRTWRRRKTSVYYSVEIVKLLNCEGLFVWRSSVSMRKTTMTTLWLWMRWEFGDHSVNIDCRKQENLHRKGGSAENWGWKASDGAWFFKRKTNSSKNSLDLAIWSLKNASLRLRCSKNYFISYVPIFFRMMLQRSLLQQKRSRVIL